MNTTPFWKRVRMANPKMFNGYTLYRIFYGEELVYIGRTMQPLQDRIRGHLFGRPMHRKIDIDLVSRIEYCQFPSQADMYLYEIYFINKYKPPLNSDDKAQDTLTISLPEPEWSPFETPLWSKWERIINKKKAEETNKKEELLRFREEDRKMRASWRMGQITEEDYFSWRAKNWPDS